MRLNMRRCEAPATVHGGQCSTPSLLPPSCRSPATTLQPRAVFCPAFPSRGGLHPVQQLPLRSGNLLGCSPSRKPRSRCAVVRAGQQQQRSRVAFNLLKHVNFGEVVVLVGSHEALGSPVWDTAHGTRLEWSDGDAWGAEVELPPGAELEYKYVVVRQSDGTAVEWQPCSNLSLSVPECDGAVIVQDEWSGAQRLVCTERGAWGASLASGSADTVPPAPPRDAEEAVAKADVGVFTYVEVLFGGGKGRGAPATASRNGHSNGHAHHNGHSNGNGNGHAHNGVGGSGSNGRHNGTHGLPASNGTVRGSHTSAANGVHLSGSANANSAVLRSSRGEFMHELVLADPPSHNGIGSSWGTRGGTIGGSDLLQRLRSAMRRSGGFGAGDETTWRSPWRSKDGEDVM